MHQRRTFIAWLVVTLALLVASGLVTGLEPARPAAALSGPTVSPTASRMAHISGGNLSFVVWGDLAPAPGAVVELRVPTGAPDHNSVVASTVADGDGRCALGSVSPGDYLLFVEWPDGVLGEPGLSVHVSGGAPAMAVVALDRDLHLLAPGIWEEVTETPTLSWSEYPATAVQYRLLVMDAGTTRPVVQQVVAGTSLALSRLTPGRTYDWEVAALASDGSQLARVTGVFTVRSSH